MPIEKKLKEQIASVLKSSKTPIEDINELKALLGEYSPVKSNPVDKVIWVPKEMVVANDYNPNSVAPKEMRLLYTSVREDGYTQPIVTVWDESKKKYVIIDGFHRNLVIRKFSDINERCCGYLPIVVLEKNIDQRMAATVRHNRARGSHSVDGMSNIIYSMLKDGCSEKEICDKLGLERKEFVKMMYITGFAKIFKNYHYSQAIEKVVKTADLEKELEERSNGN